jgi:sugar phosphate isomerase/epimerase
MLIGTMNHPARDVVEEIRWMADMGFEFLDLTLEPPGAAPWRVEPEEIRAELERHRMRVVGHTAFYLPIASSFDEVRKGAVAVLGKCIEIFARVGASWMNIHPDRHTPFHDRAFFIRRNLESLGELLPVAERFGIGLMIENLPGEFNSVAQLSELLNPLPQLGLHLDFGHANLEVSHNTSAEILREFGSRLRHVHLHDNRGGRDDLHLPLGAGNVDVSGVVEGLKNCGYDDTITLEVFTPDRHHLSYSRDVLRRLWDSGVAAMPA